MIQVEYFGLHWDGGIGWLQQGRNATNFVGLSKRSPYQNPKGMCNHMIPPTAPVPDKLQWAAFLKISEDPLVKAMLPVPHPEGERAFYINDPYDDLSIYLTCLSRLSSPITSVVKPAWTVRPAAAQRELNATNVQPWVITQVSTKEASLVSDIAKATNYFPRVVVMTGKPEVPVPSTFTRIETSIRDTPLEDLMVLSLENIGAALVRRYARKEELFAPMETRKERRARTGIERHGTP